MPLVAGASVDKGRSSGPYRALAGTKDSQGWRRRLTRPSSESRNTLLLLAPPLVVFFVLLVLPLALVADQSFRVFQPGGVGASNSPEYTSRNYSELLEPAYGFYFIQTFRIATI